MHDFLKYFVLIKQKLSVNIFKQKIFCFENEDMSFFHLQKGTKWKHFFLFFSSIFWNCTKKNIIKIFSLGNSSFWQLGRFNLKYGK